MSALLGSVYILAMAIAGYGWVENKVSVWRWKRSHR